VERPEVADIFRKFGTLFLDKFNHVLSLQQRRALSDITNCRTSVLGSHRRRCDVCAHEEVSYNSCRNRHCPKCQATKRRQWLQLEASHLLDTEYFHVVFTLPEALGPIALRNQRVIYGLLFKAVADAITTIARDPKHLGVSSGFTAVLHTWGQTLDHHPHVHCVVPGGGLSPDGSSWIPCRAGFYLPVKVLSRRFRETFIRLLSKSYEAGEIAFPGKIAPVAGRWTSFVASLRKHEWVVYSKPPFGGPKQVLKYLANYTHRVAISNQRLVAIEDGEVRFRWKNYRSGRSSIMSLDGTEFIRRFLMHVLPRGFVRIRHFGFLANAVRETKLAHIRELHEPPEMPAAIVNEVERGAALPVVIEVDDPKEVADPRCPQCEDGRLRVIEVCLPDRTKQRCPG